MTKRVLETSAKLVKTRLLGKALDNVFDFQWSLIIHCGLNRGSR